MYWYTLFHSILLLENKENNKLSIWWGDEPLKNDIDDNKDNNDGDDDYDDKD